MKTNNEKLKALREAAGLSIDQVAEAICRHAGTVRNWEVPGGKQGPSAHCLKRLSELYNYPVEDLFPIKKRRLETFNGAKLAELRKRAGLTVWKLCGELGYICAPQALHMWERCKLRPSKEKSDLLADYFGVDHDYFFN